MTYRRSAAALACILSGLCWAADAQPAGGTGRFNLTGAPDRPRFPLTDRVWPAQPGEASLCLWKDDKYAAYSVTIDDNCAMDVPWWLEQSQAYGLPLTWFLITGDIGNPKGNAVMAGTWSLWRSVLDAGHDIGSHSVTHWHGFGQDGTPPADWQGFAWECSESKRQIEVGLPGHQVRMLAYPGGPGQKRNDPAVAMQTYVAARGLTGINKANQIDYGQIKYMSRATWGDAKTPWAVPTNILSMDPRNPHFRGWASPLFHFVGKPEMKPVALQALAFYKDNAAELWGGRIGDVARYGQERDTATLCVASSTNERIAIDLSDGMDDAIYDLPLTVKLRLPAAWANAQASQDGKPCQVTVVEHEGARFALIGIVPDRGRCLVQSL